MDADGEPLDPILITRHLQFSLPYRSLFSRGMDVEHVPTLIDAIVVLLVRLHLAGFYWGDVSLSNTLFRRDAGDYAAYLVDAETAERDLLALLRELAERFADRHAVWQELLHDGVLIRETGPAGMLRVSIGTPAEMQAFTDFALQIMYPPNPVRNLVRFILAAVVVHHYAAALFGEAQSDCPPDTDAATRNPRHLVREQNDLPFESQRQGYSQDSPPASPSMPPATSS